VGRLSHKEKTANNERPRSHRAIAVFVRGAYESAGEPFDTLRKAGG